VPKHDVTHTNSHPPPFVLVLLVLHLALTPDSKHSLISGAAGRLGRHTNSDLPQWKALAICRPFC
jgi:hypothetical protein